MVLSSVLLLVAQSLTHAGLNQRLRGRKTLPGDRVASWGAIGRSAKVGTSEGQVH